MVDVSNYFIDAAGLSSNARSAPSSPNKALHRNLRLSNILSKSTALLKDLSKFERLLGKIAEEYIGYHNFIKAENALLQSPLSINEKKEFDQQSALFIVSFVREIKELRDSIESVEIKADTKHWVSHTQEVVSYLMDRLNRFSRTVQNMQKERIKYNSNPFKLHSSKFKVYDDDDVNRVKVTLKAKQQHTGSNQRKKEDNNSNQDKVSDRYEGEIASTSKMKEYEAVAEKYKEVMMVEASELQRQYSEDVRQVRSVEETTERIASMLSEFVRILHSQTELVDDIHVSSEEAIEAVKRSNRELQLTIDRSKSNQWNMVILATVLAFLILLLDLITP